MRIALADYILNWGYAYMCKLYKYKVIREDWDGIQGERAKTYFSFEDNLKVGGLYVHLGKGFPGFQRVLSVEIVEL